MKTFIVCLTVAIGLGGLGFANYIRNAHLEEGTKPRPYKGFSEAEVDALIVAYTGERDGLSNRLKNTGDRTKIMDGYAPSDFGGKVNAFENFQRKNEAWRGTNRSRLEMVVELEKLEFEKQYRRKRKESPWEAILKRVVTL